MQAQEVLQWKHFNSLGQHTIFLGSGHVCSVQVNGGECDKIVLCSLRQNMVDCDEIAVIDKPMPGQKYEYHAIIPYGCKITLIKNTDVTVSYGA